MKCPVCDHDLVVERDRIDYIICEENEFCSRCGFTYNFAYGLTETIVGDTVVGMSYTANKDEFNEYQDKVKKAIERHKREWEKMMK